MGLSVVTTGEAETGSGNVRLTARAFTLLYYDIMPLIDKFKIYFTVSKMIYYRFIKVIQDYIGVFSHRHSQNT
jgi:hypothetical protein